MIAVHGKHRVLHRLGARSLGGHADVLGVEAHRVVERHRALVQLDVDDGAREKSHARVLLATRARAA